MKKNIFAILFSLLLGSAVEAQIMPSSNSSEYRNILKMSVAQFTNSTFQLGIEHFFKPTSSLYITGGFNLNDNDNTKSWGALFEAQLRLYAFTQINPNYSHRLYFAPYLYNRYYSEETRVYNGGSSSVYSWRTKDYDAISGGLLFGWSYSFAKRINLDIYTGGGVRKTIGYENPNYYNSSIFEYGYSGIMPRFGVDLGFWF